MKILAICSFPVEAAATRFRIAQFVKPLSQLGIDVTISPFLTSQQFEQIYSGGGSVRMATSLLLSILRRILTISRVRKYDILLIQREAMIFGPGVFEFIFQRIGRLPMVLDLDDATYVRYVSPSYGRIGSFFKFFGKTDRLIDRSDLVICGNRFIAEYVEKRGKRSAVMPTVVDTTVFHPVEEKNEVPVIGWIGTHSTFPFLEKLFPVLSDLSKKYRFKLKIVGSGRENVRIDGVEIENVSWQLEQEIADFQSLDIGLYPLDSSGSLDSAWLAGKSGFKAIQYMAVGVPFVMSPVGVCAEMGENGKTHFSAATPQDWYNSLETLLLNQGLRVEMGKAGRKHSLETYELEKHLETFAAVLRNVVARSNER